MKKKLLYLTSIALFSIASVNAQTTWSFSAAASTVGSISTSNGASLNVDPTNSAATKKWGPTYNATTLPTPATISASGFPGLEFAYKNGTTTNYNIQFLDGTAPNGYFQAGGKDVIITITGCTAGENIAVQYSTKGGTAVLASDFVTPTGGTPSVATDFPPNSTVNTATTSATGSTGVADIQTVNLTVTANGNVNLLSGTPGFRIYKIVKGGTLGVNDVTPSELSSVVVYGNDGKINIANVTSATKISVYNVLGSLVKSTETSGDVSLPISTSGVYIVKAQSEEGAKTVKVLVN